MPANGLVERITRGPDGNMWFTDSASPGHVGRITPTGVVTIMATGGLTPGFAVDANPEGITAGPDGNLWFVYDAEAGGPADVARITPAGVVTAFPVAAAQGQDTIAR